MQLSYNRDKNTVTVFLKGEIDHHSAKGVRDFIDLISGEDEVTELILDFGSVTFADSSAVGIVLGRFKLMNRKNGHVILQNLPESVNRIFLLSGLDKLMKIV